MGTGETVPAVVKIFNIQTSNLDQDKPFVRKMKYIIDQRADPTSRYNSWDLMHIFELLELAPGINSKLVSMNH